MDWIFFCLGDRSPSLAKVRFIISVRAPPPHFFSPFLSGEYEKEGLGEVGTHLFIEVHMCPTRVKPGPKADKRCPAERGRIWTELISCSSSVGSGAPAAFVCLLFTWKDGCYLSLHPGSCLRLSAAGNISRQKSSNGSLLQPDGHHIHHRPRLLLGELDWNQVHLLKYRYTSM